jgi:methyl-accepting chemotaxis protein
VKSTLHDLGDIQRHQTGSVLDGTRSIISSVADLSARSKKDAQEIRRCSEKIGSSVSDMITSMQYQDISKQSLEKVVESLKTNVKQPDQEGVNVSSAEPAASPEIIFTGDCLMHGYRLDKTRDLVKAALEKMVSSLENIDSSIREMTAVTNTARNNITRFLADLETTMSSVTLFLKGVVQSNREMSDYMKSLGQTVEDMSTFTQEIELISSEVELISLNARIMAAQAGAGGAGMGVIADAVKETATASEDQRVLVVARLQEISTTSESLKEALGNVTREEEEKLDQLVRELGVFLDALQSMQQKIVVMLSGIDNHGDKLTNAIKSTGSCVRISFHLSAQAILPIILTVTTHISLHRQVLPKRLILIHL